ncbi:cation-transporting atpase 4 [Stemphylium lycopersici]|nr:cation-transporting atpase 4 [Stemphylium lycopersici]
MAPTSYPMALSALIPLPFDIISTILRFWIRTKRKAWGADDWAMLINLPFWGVSTIATIGMAWSGVGQYDGSLTEYQYSNSLREPWCFTLITIKCSIGFALIRIASGKKWIEYVIYICMVSCFIVMGGTGMYLFFQCMPVQKNWYVAMEGECQPRTIQTTLSYAVAVVSITTDWIFATLPIFLLWDVQLDWRVKGSVMAMLGLGIFASIAPIVRLKFLIGLNDQTRLLENLSDILAWASAEMNVGMFVANLPACHPLLKHLIARFSTWTGTGNSRDFSSPSGHNDNNINGGGNNRSRSTRRRLTGQGAGPGGITSSSKKQWMELEDTARPDSITRNYLGGKSKGTGVETKIYGDLDDYSNGSDDDDDDGDARDDGSQKRIVGQQQSLDGMHVNVQRDFRVEITSGGGGGGDGDGAGPGVGQRGYVASRTRRADV